MARLTYEITTQDPVAFATQMGKNGLGVKITLGPEGKGPITADLDGWELLYIGTHYPEHTLSPRPEERLRELGLTGTCSDEEEGPLDVEEEALLEELLEEAETAEGDGEKSDEDWEGEELIPEEFIVIPTKVSEPPDLKPAAETAPQEVMG